MLQMRTARLAALACLASLLSACHSSPRDYDFNEIEFGPEYRLLPLGPHLLYGSEKGDSYSYTRGSFLVSVGHGGEAPLASLTPPKALPPLTSISLVRVFNANPEYIVVAGNYEVSGELKGLHIGGSKNGEWIPIEGYGNFFKVVITDPRLALYGLPGRIDVARYLRSRHLPIPVSSSQQTLTVINQHYGYDKLIRQDTLRADRIVSSRFLTPSTTKEEQVSNPPCEAEFRKQPSKRQPTVQ